MRWRRGLLDVAPLADPAFRGLWLGSSAGAIGRQVANVAVLYQVWDLTHSPVWTGAIGLVQAVPLVVLGLYGGTLADAHDRRTIIRLTTIGQLVVALGLAAQAVTGGGHLALVLGLVGTQAAVGALGAPAGRTVPARLLPPGKVAAGIALQSLAFQVAMLAGPAIGGLVLGQFGLTWAYVAQAVASGLFLAGTLRLPRLPPDGASHRPGARAIGEGWRMIARRPQLQGAFLTDLAATLLAMPIAVFPLVNEIRFGGDPRTLGLFLSAVAFGGIGASLLSGTVTRARRAGMVQLGAAFTWGLALAAFGLAQPVWLALAALAVAGAADTVSVVTRSALVQVETPDSHRGRVSAVEHVIGVAGPEVGNFRGGWLAGVTSASFSLVAGGLACAVAVAAIAVRNRPLREYRSPRGKETVAAS